MNFDMKTYRIREIWVVDSGDGISSKKHYVYRRNAKKPENGCPARISSKTLRETDEFTGNEEETAATGFRRKTLGK